MSCATHRNLSKRARPEVYADRSFALPFADPCRSTVAKEQTLCSLAENSLCLRWQCNLSGFPSRSDEEADEAHDCELFLPRECQPLARWPLLRCILPHPRSALQKERA